MFAQKIKREREREMRKKKRLRNKLPVVHRRYDDTRPPFGTHRPPSLLSPPIENMREGRERAREGTISRPRETVFNGENYQIARLLGLSVFMNSDERLHGITISLFLPSTAGVSLAYPSVAYYGLLLVKVTIATNLMKWSDLYVELYHDVFSPKVSFPEAKKRRATEISTGVHRREL